MSHARRDLSGRTFGGIVVQKHDHGALNGQQFYQVKCLHCGVLLIMRQDTIAGEPIGCSSCGAKARWRIWRERTEERLRRQRATFERWMVKS